MVGSKGLERSHRNVRVEGRVSCPSFGCIIRLLVTEDVNMGRGFVNKDRSSGVDSRKNGRDRFVKVSVPCRLVTTREQAQPEVRIRADADGAAIPGASGNQCAGKLECHSNGPAFSEVVGSRAEGRMKVQGAMASRSSHMAVEASPTGPRVRRGRAVRVNDEVREVERICQGREGLSRQQDVLLDLEVTVCPLVGA